MALPHTPATHTPVLSPSAPLALTLRDGGVLLLLLAAMGLYSLLFDFSAKPTEDAAILMRYALHLAQGHGIVWNVGGPPVDGATDFLFLVMVAGLARAGLAIEPAVRLICLVSHVLTVLLVYLAVRRLHHAPIWAAGVSAGFVALGPGWLYALAYFGTPFFALFSASTWYMAHRVVATPTRRLSLALFALSGLVLGLIRPEGVFLAGFMLLAVVYAPGWRGARPALISFVLVFLLLGGAYFLWRWSYFGYPLPNPFYKKGGGALYPGSLAAAAQNVLLLGLPFLWVYVIGLHPRVIRGTLFPLIPLVGFTLLWVLLSNEMNFYRRFQYALVPVLAISWYPVLARIRSELGLFAPHNSRLLPPARLAGLFALAVLAYQLAIPTVRWSHDDRYDMGRALAAYSGYDYRLATSEAGLLPFYSRWRTLDTWGLNDQWIAHNGGLTAEYLAAFDPHLVMIFRNNEFLPDAQRPDLEERRTMVRLLESYVEEHDFVLANEHRLAPEVSYTYYVNPDFAHSPEIIDLISSFELSRDGNRAAAR